MELKDKLGQAFKLVVKIPVKMFMCRSGVPGLNSSSQFQLLSSVDLGKQQVMAQGVGSLPPSSET